MTDSTITVCPVTSLLSIMTDSRVRNEIEKIDCHKFSGMVSQCVEWFDPNIDRTNREASSLSFLQEK